jgi:hypothetical protein
MDDLRDEADLGTEVPLHVLLHQLEVVCKIAETPPAFA